MAREGKHLTIVTWSAMVWKALEAAERLEPSIPSALPFYVNHHCVAAGEPPQHRARSLRIGLVATNRKRIDVRQHETDEALELGALGHGMKNSRYDGVKE